MRRLISLGAVILLAAVLAGAGLASGWRPEPEVRGTDEIDYIDVQGLPVQPGASVEEQVPLQHPDLSLISLPYRIENGQSSAVQVRVATRDGRVLSDRTYLLDSTPLIDSRTVWFQSTFWGPVAKYADIPVAGAGGAGDLVITVAVPVGRPAVTLFFNAVSPATGGATAYPEGKGPNDVAFKRLAVRTGYGPIRAAPLRFWTYESRVAELAPPWLRHPLPVVLIVACLALAAFVVGRITWSNSAPD